MFHLHWPSFTAVKQCVHSLPFSFNCQSCYVQIPLDPSCRTLVSHQISNSLRIERKSELQTCAKRGQRHEGFCSKPGFKHVLSTTEVMEFGLYKPARNRLNRKQRIDNSWQTRSFWYTRAMSYHTYWKQTSAAPYG